MPEINRKPLSVMLFAAVSAVAVASSSALCYVLARWEPVEKSKTEEKTKPAVKEKTKPAVKEKTETGRAIVRSIDFCGEDNGIRIEFSHRPKADELLHYVSTSPNVDGVTVDVESDGPYPWRREIKHWAYLKSAGFKFRTPYAVTVKRGLPFDGGAKLERDALRTVVRPDLAPSITFADAGRYLPQAGDRTVAIDVVNVSNIECSVRRVLPENIVQLLAREERQYRKSLGWWPVRGDSEATAEISSAPACWSVEVGCLPNERVRRRIPLHGGNGTVSNGVYLLSVGNKDRDTGTEHRLVCLTDIGLSVRRDRHGLRVWATSLATGRPVSGAEARLYAANRELLAAARTGTDGEAVLEGWDSGCEEFALVVSGADGSDMVFMAIKDSMKIDETMPGGARPDYKAACECRAFVWTDRGIYRHGEKIMVHAILRNGMGNAPEPFPVKISLEDPSGREAGSSVAMSDEFGAVMLNSFTAPDNMPSGKWKIKVSTPGGKGSLLGSRTIKIEDFAPPQIRASLKNMPADGTSASNFTYTVAAEHLFGGAAKRMAAESLVAFSDVGFAPEGWKGFRFGDARRGLRPNYTRLPPKLTDGNGEARFEIGLNSEWGMPKAAVKITVQGSVLEAGGRSSVTRGSRTVHLYPYYIGSDIPRYVRQRPGTAPFRIVQVAPDGKPYRSGRRLKAALWKIERAYNLVRNGNGSVSWDGEDVRVRMDVDGTVDVGGDGAGTVDIPVSGSGDYEFTVEDEELGLSHSARFWVSADGDDEARADFRNPASVSISADKEFYREGDRPRLTIKTPFRGAAWLAVMRERTLCTRVLELTNLTSVVELDPLDGALAPNIDVAVSVVQAAGARENRLAARAHGIVPLRIRTRDSELPVELSASVKHAAGGGSEVEVSVTARGEFASGERAVVTVVDEGINMLTGESIPDPAGFFAMERGGWHPLYDMYGRLLPVYDSRLAAGGAKTGGDGLAELMNRVSPTPSRRFKPLSLRSLDIPLSDGAGTVRFSLPEFVGEVRVTAVAYGKRATGSRAIRRKVSPKLVMLPDAPRFAAPGDRFALTLSLANRSGNDADVEYDVSCSGAVRLVCGGSGRETVKNGDSRILTILAEAKAAIGAATVRFSAKGCGETHVCPLELPVRPAAAWNETAEVRVLKPGESFTAPAPRGSAPMQELARRTFTVCASPVAELAAAIDYLAEYPHGCLEQTTSRMFPLVSGGSFLDRLPSSATSKASEVRDMVDAGIARIASMLRQNDFAMWPDVNDPPWNREVSLYAAHFLVEAESAGFRVPGAASKRVRNLLGKWAFDADTNISVYACHTLALAGRPEKDRMFSLYEARDSLSLLSRARLSRGFARIGDPRRARELVADAAMAPDGVVEAAFAMAAILEMDSKDRRLPGLALYLQKRRDRRRFHWGTTGDNAHALMSLAAYYAATDADGGSPFVSASDRTGRTTPLHDGESVRIDGGGDVVLDNRGTGDAFVSVKTLALPDANSVAAEHNLIRISRRFMTCEGVEADMDDIARGELLIGEITLETDRDFDFSDLVVQDLLPACLEPDRAEIAEAYRRRHGKGSTEWVLRSDTRDDRVIVFSKPVSMKRDAPERKKSRFFYAARAATPGDFMLPGIRVEAMYAPEIRAQTAPSRIRVKQQSMP